MCETNRSSPTEGAKRGEEGGGRRKPAPGKVCCEMRVEFLVAAELGGREKGRRKGSEVKLNKMRVGRGGGGGSGPISPGGRAKLGKRWGRAAEWRGRMEATCGPSAATSCL